MPRVCFYFSMFENVHFTNFNFSPSCVCAAARVLFTCKNLANSHSPHTPCSPRRHPCSSRLPLTQSILFPHVKDGNTALIWASYNGHTAAVELLVAAGADKDAKSNVRDRDSERMTHKERERMVEWLRRRWAHSHSPTSPARYMCCLVSEWECFARAQFSKF